MRLVLALLVLALLAACGPAAARAAPRLVVGTTSVEAAGPRAVTVRGAIAPGGRRVAYRVAYRRVGGAWKRTRSRRLPARRRQAVTAVVTDLRPATTYGARLVATSCRGCRSGTRRSRERLFRTPAEPALVPAEPPPPGPPTLAPSRTAEATARLPGPAPAPAPAPRPEPGPGSYRNAVWDLWEFADPTVIHVGDTYYAYASGDGFQVMRSKDLVHWEWLGAALGARPPWVVGGGDWHPWAPSVLSTDEPCPGAAEPGCFLMFYVGLSSRYGTTTNCTAVATSPTPEGPFTDRGPLERSDGVRDGGWPVGCGDTAGYGNIDPQPFVDDDGKAWLYLSTDWRCTATGPCELRPEISVIPLAADRLRAAGPREPLLSGRATSWEQAPWAPVVENPWVLKRGATYHLLYSGGSWQGAYAMGHATAPAPDGPFTRTSPEPWTGTTAEVVSMGGGSIVRDGADAEWLVYHGRDGSLDMPRTLRIDRLRWTEDDLPELDGPSTAVRAAPTP